MTEGPSGRVARPGFPVPRAGPVRLQVLPSGSRLREEIVRLIPAIEHFVGPVEVLAERLRPDDLDLVLLELQPGSSEIAEAIRSVGAKHPAATVVSVGASVSPTEVRAALTGGAAAYIDPADLHRTLPSAIAGVLAGQIVLPRGRQRDFSTPVLSGRERQVLAMLVMDLSNAEIARKLVVTESTVKSHLSSAYRKLGVPSRNQAKALILDPERGLGTGILSIGAGEEL